MNKSYNKLIEETLSNLEDSGVTVNKAVVRLVIDAYKQVRINTLINCDSYTEDGIGTVEVSRRKLSTAFNPSREYSAGIKTSIQDPLWSSLTRKVNSNEYK